MKELKKIITFLLLLGAPWLFIWFISLLSGFTINPIVVFKSQIFWLLAGVYYFFWLICLGLIIDIIQKIE